MFMGVNNLFLYLNYKEKDFNNIFDSKKNKQIDFNLKKMN